MIPLKVCGIRSGKFAEAAVHCGAFAVGIVLVPGSPRLATLDEAKAICTAVKGKALCVGVFADRPEEEIIELCSYLQLDVIQLHGTEPPATLYHLAEATKLKIWKALSIRTIEDLQLVDVYQAAETLVLDNLKGGSGELCNWTLAASVAAKRKVLLAGGINEDNAETAWREVQPFGLDLSSALEKERGVKDSGLLERFFKAIEHVR